MLSLQFLAATLFALPTAIVLLHVAIYLVDPYGLRQYPGPFLAKFTDAWLGWVTQQGHRSEVIHELHKRYGSFVRISPSEVSIADLDAHSIVYAHGNGALKSSFYDGFLSGVPGLFNTRDRVQHARKRKIISHIFSQKSVVEFAPHIHLHIAALLRQWNRLYDDAVKGLSGSDGEGGWNGHDGRLWLHCLPWANYLAFDITSDLAFGTAFGMIPAARDAVAVPANWAAPTDVTFPDPAIKYVPAIAVLTERVEYITAMAVLPAWWRPFVARLPWYRARQPGSREYGGIAVVAVEKRLATPTERADLLSKLHAGKDEHGQPLGRAELTAEAQTFLTAGSDTTSNSVTAIIHHLAANSVVQACLQQELDQHWLDDDPVATSEQVQNLPYLDACIKEGLRIQSTIALGLPRVAPEGGLVVCGHFFSAGSVVSVPIYTLHRDPDIWGSDPDVYRPDRWFNVEKVTAMHKAFNPFSSGPRACVGRNLAALELSLIIATLLRSYHFVLAEPEKPIETREGFIRKPIPNSTMISARCCSGVTMPFSPFSRPSISRRVLSTRRFMLLTEIYDSVLWIP
ncbi:Cytochrome P450 monooxygenase [Mycena venus]|uniref:Cytochrome P450 monooxygenase n=1 Tax=Mycena venus TaxID=2733690 RepID=A0A8H6YYV3_9AGAR|nr:Cytochrome P450 monooxygenase [Mycena venus]